MRLWIFALTFFALFTQTAGAQIRQFPYAAVIEGNGALIRSGPGKSYYPTAQLRPGNRVTVHRHDPGGWYMIAPPAGSFSWIRADYVRQQAAGHGVITQDNVIVRVGSSFGDSREIEQVRLSSGAPVKIIAEKTFATANGSVRMFKIVPPRGEFRWISGRHIVPANAQHRLANDRNPYAIPSNARRRSPATATAHRTSSRKAVSGPSFGQGELRFPGAIAETPHSHYDLCRKQLTVLDSQLLQMIGRQTASWDFTPLLQKYAELKQRSTHGAIDRKIVSRFAAIRHYRELKMEYDTMIRLTSRTDQRETRLATVQRQLGARAGLGPADPVTFASDSSLAEQQPPGFSAPKIAGRRPVRLSPPVPTAHGSGHHPLPSVLPNRQMQTTIPRRTMPQMQTTIPRQTTVSPPRRSQPPRFDGAGIIRRVAPRTPGTPEHVLVAPNGRILAYLQAVPGLPLDRYVGRPMGVFGRRSRRADLQNDFIVVRAMMPVRLLP